MTLLGEGGQTSDIEIETFEKLTIVHTKIPYLQKIAPTTYLVEGINE